MEDYSAALVESEARSKDLHVQIEAVRRDIAAIDKEINESGATMSNLRDNIIVRKLKEKVEAIEREIVSYDMEEAAKARRNYEDKYQPAKAREQKLNEVVRLLYPFGTINFKTFHLVSSTNGRAGLTKSSGQDPRRRLEAIQGHLQEVHRSTD